MSRSRAKSVQWLMVNEEILAAAIAAADLISPTPLTQGDVERFWATRATADRKFYMRRARQIFRMLTLPEGAAGSHMGRERQRKAG